MRYQNFQTEPVPKNVGFTPRKNSYSEPDAELRQEVANQVALAIKHEIIRRDRALKVRLEKENLYLQESKESSEHRFAPKVRYHLL